MPALLLHTYIGVTKLVKILAKKPKVLGRYKGIIISVDFHVIIDDIDCETLACPRRPNFPKIHVVTRCYNHILLDLGTYIP